jgi:hypothetical protein
VGLFADRTRADRRADNAGPQGPALEARDLRFAFSAELLDDVGLVLLVQRRLRLLADVDTVPS